MGDKAHVDLDSLNGNLDLIREKLLQDKHVMACFVSPTGSGLKALIPIQADAGSHEASFRAAQRLFQERYGIAIDGQCKDVARLCFVGADPNILVRASAEILQPLGTRQEPALEADPYDKLVEQFGLPYTVNDKGSIRCFSLRGSLSSTWSCTNQMSVIFTLMTPKPVHGLPAQQTRSKQCSQKIGNISPTRTAISLWFHCAQMHYLKA